MPIPGYFPREDRRVVAWFEPEDYSRIEGVVLNPQKMPWNYEVWREAAESTERYHKRRGCLVVRVVIRVDEFFAWCTARAKEPNSDALSDFIGLKKYAAAPPNYGP